MIQCTSQQALIGVDFEEEQRTMGAFGKETYQKSLHRQIKFVFKGKFNEQGKN